MDTRAIDKRNAENGSFKFWTGKESFYFFKVCIRREPLKDKSLSSHKKWELLGSG